MVDCGDFSLSELRALVDRAALYIGGDSGPMHIAATSHVPMISLYGPTLPARSAAVAARSNSGRRRSRCPASRAARATSESARLATSGAFSGSSPAGDRDG